MILLHTQKSDQYCSYNLSLGLIAVVTWIKWHVSLARKELAWLEILLVVVTISNVCSRRVSRQLYLNICDT